MWRQRRPGGTGSLLIDCLESAISLDVKTFYSAYGLAIDSEVPLPDFASVERERADVVVRRERLDEPAAWDDRIGELRYALRPDGGGLCIYWHQAGMIEVRDGRQIVVDLLPDADPVHVALFLSGPGLNTLLHQRGVVVLHASGVEIDGGCVAFLGASGWGKSTIASALHRRGYRLVADDGIAVTDREEGVAMVLPSFPALKLWPASLADSDPGEEDLPKVLPGVEKRLLRIDDGFVGDTIPLRAIYLLGRSGGVRIEEIGGRDGVIELVRHSSRIQMLHGLDPARHFAGCAWLASQVRIKRLVRPMDFARLDEVLEAIELDLDND